MLSAEIQLPNDRGPLFEGTCNFDLLVKPPGIFYWNSNWINNKFHSMYTANYNNLMANGLPKHYTSLYLLGDDLTLLEIYNTCSKFKIDLLLVDNMPAKGTFNKNEIKMLNLDRQPIVFISKNKINLKFIEYIMPDLKHLYIYKLTSPSAKKYGMVTRSACKLKKRKKLTLEDKMNVLNISDDNSDTTTEEYKFNNLKSISCVYCTSSLLNSIIAPKLDTLDIYSIVNADKMENVDILKKNLNQLKFLRLDTKLLSSLNFEEDVGEKDNLETAVAANKIQRLQFYGQNDGLIDDKQKIEFYTNINKIQPDDLILPLNMLTERDIDNLTWNPKSIGVYHMDIQINRFIDKFLNNLYIYGTRNIHQMAFYRNNTLYCNFNIYNRMNEWSIIYNIFVNKKMENVKICSEIVKPNGLEEEWPSTIYTNKKRKIDYDFLNGILKITSSSSDLEKLLRLIDQIKLKVENINTLIINTNGANLNQNILRKMLKSRKYPIENIVFIKSTLSNV